MVRIAAKYSFSSDIGGVNEDAASGDLKSQTYTVAYYKPKPGRRYGVQVVSASTTNSDPNVSAARANNKLTYTSTTTAPTGIQTLTIPDGKYTLAALEDEIARQTLALGHGTLLTPVFQLSGNESTALVTIKINYAGFSVDCSATASVMTSLLGFASAATVGPTASPPELYTAASQANFEQGVLAHRIHCSAVMGSYSAQGRRGSGMVTIPLNSGSLNSVVTVQNSLSTNILQLASEELSTLDYWITDQADREITLNGSAFAVEFLVLEVDE